MATTSRPGQRAAGTENLSHDLGSGGAGENGTGEFVHEQIRATFPKSKNGLVMTKNLEECGLVQDRLIAGEVSYALLATLFSPRIEFVPGQMEASP